MPCSIFRPADFGLVTNQSSSLSEVQFIWKKGLCFPSTHSCFDFVSICLLGSTATAPIEVLGRSSEVLLTVGTYKWVGVSTNYGFMSG